MTASSSTPATGQEADASSENRESGAQDRESGAGIRPPFGDVLGIPLLTLLAIREFRQGRAGPTPRGRPGEAFTSRISGRMERVYGTDCTEVAVGKNLRKLEGEGFIRSFSSDVDGRRTCWSLTDRGEEFLDRLAGRIDVVGGEDRS